MMLIHVHEILRPTLVLDQTSGLNYNQQSQFSGGKKKSKIFHYVAC